MRPGRSVIGAPGEVIFGSSGLVRDFSVNYLRRAAGNFAVDSGSLAISASVCRQPFMAPPGGIVLPGRICKLDFVPAVDRTFCGSMVFEVRSAFIGVDDAAKQSY